MSQRLRLKDSAGKTYVAYKVSGQRFETADSTPGGQADADGIPRYELDDGRPLHYHDDTEEFELVETGERLKRIEIHQSSPSQ